MLLVCGGDSFVPLSLVLGWSVLDKQVRK